MNENGKISFVYLEWLVYVAFLLLLFLGLKCVGMPFVAVIFAFFAATVIDRAAIKISKKISLSKRVCSAALVISFFGALAVISAFFAVRLVSECEGLIFTLSKERAALTEYVLELTERIEEFLSFDGEGGDAISEIVLSAINDIVSAVTVRLGGLLGRILGNIPSVAVSIIAFAISCFYFSVDIDRISSFCSGHLPPRVYRSVSNAARILSDSIVHYIRASAIIFLVTFFEIFIGFLILGVPYAMIIAAAVSAVDILPVLGSGAILVPWAFLALLTGNFQLGLGLLVLYGVVTIIRQVIEPRIVGASLGIHPLLSFLLMLFGMGIFGVFGAVLGPMIGVLLSRYIKNKKMYI